LSFLTCLRFIEAWQRLLESGEHSVHAASGGMNAREMQAIELPHRLRRHEQLNGAEIFFEYHESPYART
jgi:hypothetical protein